MLASRLAGRRHLPEIDSRGLFADIERREAFVIAEVDHFHRAGIGADAFFGDEDVSIVGVTTAPWTTLRLVGSFAEFFAGFADRRWKRTARACWWR